MEPNLPTYRVIAPPPKWLTALVSSPSRPSNCLPLSHNINNQAMAGIVGFQMPPEKSVGEGQRNNFLAQAAGWLKSQGVQDGALEELLHSINFSKCSPPLKHTEVKAVANSIAKYGATLPPSVEDWPEPQPIRESLPPVATVEHRMLPAPIADYVFDVADRMGCPPDFPASAGTVALSAAIGGSIHCRPYEKGTWMVPAGLWGMLISPPSAIKSPPISEMFRPLKALDKQAADQYAIDYAKFEIDQKIYERAIKNAVNAGNTQISATPPVEPQMRRHIVNDSTYERLIEIAAANPKGILVFRDELLGWYHSLAKDNQREARGLYLTGWSGTESYATDRIGRGHVRADSVNISLFGTIQPQVLRPIVQDAVIGGGGDDGLTQRFQFAVYPDPITTYKKVDRYPDYAAMKFYEQAIARLVNINPAAVGAQLSPDGIPYLPFSPKAQILFDDWRDVLEKRIRATESDEHPALLAHLAKYRSLVPKIAMTLHLAAGHTGPICEDATLQALHWVSYLESHARRMYHTATNRALQCAATLANKIQAGKLPTPFTRSDLLLREWASLRSADEINLALMVLRDMGWLKQVEDKQTGGRPAERYHINPRIKRAG